MCVLSTTLVCVFHHGLLRFVGLATSTADKCVGAPYCPGINSALEVVPPFELLVYEGLGAIYTSSIRILCLEVSQTGICVGGTTRFVCVTFVFVLPYVERLGRGDSFCCTSPLDDTRVSPIYNARYISNQGSVEVTVSQREVG